MIDLIARTVTLGSRPMPILRFDVWFAGPFGLCTTIDEAIAQCIALDVDPNYAIKSLPVAVTENSYEVLK